MQTLDQALAEVEKSRRDLSAEIVHQEEEGHMEEQKHGTDLLRDVWVVDKPRITEHDAKAREDAEIKLNDIYNSSEWYSARYKAGISLGMDAKKLSCDAHSWLPDIRRRLRAEKTQEIVNAAAYENEEVKTGKIVDGVPETRNIVVLKPKANKIAFADREKRLMALKDAARLYEISRMGILEEILQDTYLNNNCRDVRIQAGRYLGHSKIRVTLGEFYRGAFKQQPPPYTHP